MKQSQQEIVLQIEAYLADYYMFRNNCLSGKTEVLYISSTSDKPSKWTTLTQMEFNTIVRNAKLNDIGGDTSPRQNIEEYINSSATPKYNPIVDYLDNLPAWDGQNHMAALFSRIPGINTEQLAWCCTWFRSAVAHWMQKDTIHGNETVPLLIGAQGCGKSTFANRLLPEHLRCYFISRMNFGNKFDRDMALSSNLIVNLDEFDRFGPTQQAHLKQALSEAKVNGRPIFGKSQEDRPRYASFIATTNCEKPLTDPTGSRRFICLRIPNGQFIDNLTDINYEQLFAQAVNEVNSNIPYWFNNADVERIQLSNIQFFHSDDLEEMLKGCYRFPEENETVKWVAGSVIYETLKSRFPSLGTQKPETVKSKIGKILRELDCQKKKSNHGVYYQLIPLVA